MTEEGGPPVIVPRREERSDKLLSLVRERRLELTHGMSLSASPASRRVRTSHHAPFSLSSSAAFSTPAGSFFADALARLLASKRVAAFSSACALSFGAKGTNALASSRGFSAAAFFLAAAGFSGGGSRLRGAFLFGVGAGGGSSATSSMLTSFIEAVTSSVGSA